jgi:outer membrane biosynthesis protein TonB
MRSGSALAALAMLLALLTGCGPKQPKTAVPQEAQAPSQPPSRMVALIPAVPPPFPVTARQAVKLDTTTPPEIKTEVATTEPRHPPKHHSRPLQEPAQAENSKTTGQSQSPAQTTAQVTQQPGEKTAIGQLSAANDNSNTADRHGISAQIDSTESGLNAIKRPFSADEQKTAVLIRTYITRARDALKADDLDGAKVLSDKAKQLLEELTKA